MRVTARASNKKRKRGNMRVAERTGRADGVGSGVSGSSSVCSGSLLSQTLAGCCAVGANWQLHPVLQGLNVPNTDEQTAQTDGTNATTRKRNSIRG